MPYQCTFHIFDKGTYYDANNSTSGTFDHSAILTFASSRYIYVEDTTILGCPGYAIYTDYRVPRASEAFFNLIGRCEASVYVSNKKEKYTYAATAIFDPAGDIDRPYPYMDDKGNIQNLTVVSHPIHEAGNAFDLNRNTLYYQWWPAKFITTPGFGIFDSYVSTRGIFLYFATGEFRDDMGWATSSQHNSNCGMFLSSNNPRFESRVEWEQEIRRLWPN
jgi:hypothetical protein